jgi:hypothetical protein
MEAFEQVYEQLRGILKPFEASLRKEQDTPQGYSLNTPYSKKWGKEIFFGAATIKKNYVSFYLMPVYMHPELLEGISPELKARMQGKSCFNFKKMEPALFEELNRLTKRSFDRCKQEDLA